MNSRNKHEKRYKIAFSFPGEYRNLVDKIANGVADVFTKECILYDSFHSAEFARPNLDTYLQNLYRNESELVVIFICGSYNRKTWCGVEWRALRDLINTGNNDRILFVKCGDGDVDGFFSSVDGFIDASAVAVDEIIEDVVIRYSMLSKNQGNTLKTSKSDDVPAFLTPTKLFNELFKSSMPIIICNDPICKTAYSFYRSILPAKIINIDPTIWDSSTRRSRLLNGRGERSFVEKMLVSFCYEKQITELISNCNELIQKEPILVNVELLEQFVDRTIRYLEIYDRYDDRQQKANHPSWSYVTGIPSIIYFLKDIIAQNCCQEVLAMLILFSFFQEEMSSFSFHYEKSYPSRVSQATAWMHAPMYSDDDLLISTYLAVCGVLSEDAIYNNRINYRLLCQNLKTVLTNRSCVINLDSTSGLIMHDGDLVLIKGSFLLEDLYTKGRHLSDFQDDVFKLIEVDQSTLTFMFSNITSTGESCRFFASGDKFNIRLVHLLQVIYESDRIFPLSVIGYLHAVKEKCYSVKPIIIGYNSHFRLF